MNNKTIIFTLLIIIILFVGVFTGVKMDYRQTLLRYDQEVVKLFTTSLSKVSDVIVERIGGAQSVSSQISKKGSNAVRLSNKNETAEFKKTEEYNQLSFKEKLSMNLWSFSCKAFPIELSLIDSLFQAELSTQQITASYAFQYTDRLRSSVYGDSTLLYHKEYARKEFLLGVENEINIALVWQASPQTIIPQMALMNKAVIWVSAIVLAVLAVAFGIAFLKNKRRMEEIVEQKNRYLDSLTQTKIQVEQQELLNRELQATIDMNIEKELLEKELEEARTQLEQYKRHLLAIEEEPSNILCLDNQLFYSRKELLLFYQDQPVMMSKQMTRLFNLFINQDHFSLSIDELQTNGWSAMITDDALRQAVSRMNKTLNSYGIRIDRTETGFRLKIENQES